MIRSLIPLNLLRVIVCVCMVVGFAAAVVLFPGLLHLTQLEAVPSLFPLTFVIALLVSIILYVLFANGRKPKQR